MNRHWYWPVIIAIYLTGCSPVLTDRPVHHVVLLWLKPGTTPAVSEKIIGLTRQLTSIESVDQVHVGRPLPGNRTIVDSSFDIGIYFRFSSKQAMDAYLSHPQHLSLLEKHIKPNIARIVIYDF